MNSDHLNCSLPQSQHKDIIVLMSTYDSICFKRLSYAVPYTMKISEGESIASMQVIMMGKWFQKNKSQLGGLTASWLDSQVFFAALPLALIGV